MSVPLDDRGFALGDGLFETILWSAGRLVLFDPHFARLSRGCEALGLPAPELEAVRYAALAEVEAAGLVDGRAAVRVTWTAGSGGRGLDRPEPLSPRLLVTAARAPAPVGPATLAVAATRRNQGSPASRLKTLAYLDNVLARREARASGADEALMLNGRGEIACAAAANLFWFEEARLVTPALGCGVLDGIVRGETLKAAAELGLVVEEICAGPRALERARGLCLSNSLVGLRPVAAVDGVAVRPHPELDRLVEKVAAAVL
jgi:branched-chain amino acid aminotransferase/4-amino-4-deoxychorismate lyase